MLVLKSLVLILFYKNKSAFKLPSWARWGLFTVKNTAFEIKRTEEEKIQKGKQRKLQSVINVL